MESGGEAFATLGPSCVEYGATTTGGHTGTESVSSGSLQEAGLKCAFHDVVPFKNCLDPALAASTDNKLLTKEENCNFSWTHKQVNHLPLLHAGRELSGMSRATRFEFCAGCSHNQLAFSI